MRNVALIAAASAAVLLSACGKSEPQTSGTQPLVRQLTEVQYRAVIADVFGPDVKIAGNFYPTPREDGLMAVGASRATITPSAFERYDKLARLIAAQVVDASNRDVLVPCKPASAKAADDACATTFFSKVGRLLFRRPLTQDEIGRQVKLADEVTKTTGSFYDGLAAGLSGMLVAPDFLLIGDMVEPDPDDTGRKRLTAYSIASRLSFFLWNASPDDMLLTAAEKGELHSDRGLAKQVDRMLKSPRLEAGMRALFADMLGFDGLARLQKDPLIYPAFGLSAADDAGEQTLRTIVDQLVVHDGDYRDLFTTRKTFLSQPLGLVYRVPVETTSGWEPYEFPAGDQHVGIQSQLSLLALYSHPGRSSATLRGKAVRELLLCQKVPDPPANVDFTLVSDSANPVHKTARSRLDAHSTDPSCSGCHKLMDPIGLSLENFDGAGQYRTSENGEKIDTSGVLDGIAFQNPEELGKALHQNAALNSCLVNRVYAFAGGHTPQPADRPLLEYIEKKFVADGYRLKPLLRTIATSEGFYAVGGKTSATAEASVTP
jgi:hypothetical protein